MDAIMKSKIKTTEPDPKNAALRKKGLDTRIDPKLIIPSLKQQTQFIHAAWLFEEVKESKLLLKSLCLCLSSYSEHSSGGWNDLGGHLGLDWRTIQVIKYSRSDMDKTELCLRTYAQHRNSTLEPIIDTLGLIQRFDALNTVKQEIEKLVEYIYSEQGHTHWDPTSIPATNSVGNDQHDSAFFSLPDNDTITEDRIVRPELWKTFMLNLPISLRSDENIFNSLNNNVQTSTQDVSSLNVRKFYMNYHGAASINKQPTPQKLQPRKTIFLTFASDGKVAAERIAAKLRTPNGEREKYGVLILDENKRVLSRNLESAILTLFNGVTYVMPILTKGYLNILKTSSADPEISNALSLLDERYARYIYTLMCTEYADNSCYNDRFHCIIPDQIHYSTISKELRGQLVFRSWANETDIESFVQKLL